MVDGPLRRSLLFLGRINRLSYNVVINLFGTLRFCRLGRRRRRRCNRLGLRYRDRRRWCCSLPHGCGLDRRRRGRLNRRGRGSRRWNRLARSWCNRQTLAGRRRSHFLHSYHLHPRNLNPPIRPCIKDCRCNASETELQKGRKHPRKVVIALSRIQRRLRIASHLPGEKWHDQISR